MIGAVYRKTFEQSTWSKVEAINILTLLKYQFHTVGRADDIRGNLICLINVRIFEISVIVHHIIRNMAEIFFYTRTT
jgi:hypothetical protein